MNEPDGRAVDARYYRGVLHELIDMGADIARMVHREAGAKQADLDVGEVTVAFDRIARAVRRTVILARRLDDPMPAAAGPGRTDARKRIIRAVEDQIQLRSGDLDADSLHAELLDRLDSPDLDDEIGRRPVDEIIAEIRRDLGLMSMPGRPQWKRRTPQDVAVLCARASLAPTPAPAPGRTGRAAMPRPLRFGDG